MLQFISNPSRLFLKLDRAHQLKVAATDLSVEDAQLLVKDAFHSAGERDIYTGDHVEFFTITAQGIERSVFDLKFD